jgi:hypothetical protein
MGLSFQEREVRESLPSLATDRSRSNSCKLVALVGFAERREGNTREFEAFAVSQEIRFVADTTQDKVRVGNRVRDMLRTSDLERGMGSLNSLLLSREVQTD